MKAGFKKYKGSYKRSKSPFTDNDIDYNKRIGQPSRYKDRAKQDLKEANYARKDYARMIRQDEHPVFGVFRRGMNVAMGGIAAAHTARRAKGVAGLVKAGKIGKAGGLIAKSGLVSTALPIAGGYLLAREAIRGVQRRKEKKSQGRFEETFGKDVKFKKDPYGSSAPRSPYQKYDSAYKRDSSPFSKKKDPKKTKKRILKATDIKLKSGKNIPTEILDSDYNLKAGTGQVEGGSVNVYRKGLNKYVKKDPLYMQYDAAKGEKEFVKLSRENKRKLKKQKSYTSVRKIKKSNKKK